MERDGCDRREERSDSLYPSTMYCMHSQAGPERLIGRVRWEAVTDATEVAALYNSTVPIVNDCSKDQ